jgi:hypothetical protein
VAYIIRGLHGRGLPTVTSNAAALSGLFLFPLGSADCCLTPIWSTTLTFARRTWMDVPAANLTAGAVVLSGPRDGLSGWCRAAHADQRLIICGTVLMQQRRCGAPQPAVLVPNKYCKRRVFIHQCSRYSTVHLLQYNRYGTVQL